MKRFFCIFLLVFLASGCSQKEKYSIERPELYPGQIIIIPGENPDWYVQRSKDLHRTDK